MRGAHQGHKVADTSGPAACTEYENLYHKAEHRRRDGEEHFAEILVIHYYSVQSDRCAANQAHIDYLKQQNFSIICSALQQIFTKMRYLQAMSGRCYSADIRIASQLPNYIYC